MRKLRVYSFRILFLTAFLELFLFYRESDLLFYLSLSFCSVIWIFLESELLKNSLAGIWRNVSLCLEVSVILWMMICINTYLFGIFFGFVIFKILYLFHGSKKFLHIGIIAGFYILGAVVYTVLLRKGDTVEKFMVLFPALSLGFLAYRSVKIMEKEMAEEIEAQQNQIDGKNKLLSTLSHELRTPLAVIKTSSEILLEERPGPLNTVQHRFLKAVQDNTVRMTGFVDSILASIKVEYAWFRMKKKNMDIRPVVKKVCNDLEPFIQSRNQSLKYSYPSLLSKTTIDNNWIQQVLINLIHNASKHMGKGGRIIVSVNENEQCVVVSVSDDGSGIVNDEKPKIFSEFYQGKDSSQNSDENFDGVGLGLSIVKNVIEKHGGDVYVGSVSGLGTTLSFTLPKAGE